MNARQRVIAALGGRCAWCQSTAGPFEIDHIHGGGNQHRTQIRLPLATWLVREHQRLGYWPPGFQLLCQRCHDSKSGRRPAMPPRKGAVQHNISLPEELSRQLATLAATPDYNGSKSEVVEQALRVLFEGAISETVIAGLQQRLSLMQDDVTTALRDMQGAMQELTQAVKTLTGALTPLDSHFARLEQRETQRFEELQRAYDRLKAVVSPPTRRPAWWAWWRH